MRTRWFVPMIAIIAISGTALALRSAGDTAASPSSPAAAVDGDDGVASAAALPARVVTAGAVDIVIEPIRVDDTAAVFRIEMNTHAEDLSADLSRTSVLEVDGVEWTGATWSGDPPGGHHRAGELTFDANGPVQGSITLSISGFSAPVDASWTLGG